MKHGNMQPVVDELKRRTEEAQRRLNDQLKDKAVRSQVAPAPPQREVTPRKLPRGIFEKVPGSGRYWVRFVDASGKLRRELAGTLGMSEKLLAKRRNEVLVGKKLPESIRRRVVQFSELADDAIKYIEEEYARPADDVARAKIIKDWFKSRSAESITREEVKAALRKAAEEKNWCLSTRHHYQNIVSLAYRLAIEHDPPKVEKSPATGIRRAKENNDRVRFLTTAEEKRLREALHSKPGWAEHEPELDLAMHTGLRRTNMYVDLLWENVNLKARMATVPITKNDDPVHIALNSVALRTLNIFLFRGGFDSIDEATGRVVRNAAGEPIHVNAHWFPEAVRQAKIKNFRWHDLRHTFASRLRQKGVALGTIAEMLGHKGLKMTQRYAHLAPANLLDAVTKIENAPDTATDTTTNTENYERSRTM